MSDYQKEQLEALKLVTEHLSGFGPEETVALKKKLSDYLIFRKDADTFLSAHFSDICTETCYQSRISACCTREGIITFFADVVINVIMSDEIARQALFSALHSSREGSKCVYLGEKGCLWQIKPLVCEMFLCKEAEDVVLKNDQDLQDEWRRLQERAKTFRWPDRPVLFDELEQVFLDAGHVSPLMYLHNSPGLLRVKKDRVGEVEDKRVGSLKD